MLMRPQLQDLRAWWKEEHLHQRPGAERRRLLRACLTATAALGLLRLAQLHGPLVLLPLPKRKP